MAQSEKNSSREGGRPTAATKPKRITVETAGARLQAASRIILTTHSRADGDAVGCTLALQRALRTQGKTVATYLHEDVLDRYRFLVAGEPWSVWDPPSAPAMLASADLIVLVDTCASAQQKNLAEIIKRAPVPRLAIDHHVTRDDIADEILFDEQAGACAQIMLRLFDQAGWRIDVETARLLFAALATDTGWFRFASADRAAFEAAARLIGAGARPNELYEPLYQGDAEARARLAGAVLSSFELHAGGRLAVVRITREMLARCGATREMTEDLINEPQRVGSVNACVLFVESDDVIRVSFRSKHGVDVAAVAGRWGGGGHERAAGARLPGTMESVTKTVIPVMIEAVQRVPQPAPKS
jgi:phosphoesterase RecJ-like protein